MAISEERAAYERHVQSFGWQLLSVARTRVIRSPDRKVFILADRCTLEDVADTVLRWQPGPPDPGGGH
jgi:hypothetical protein